jgi:TRAP-type mannitol/chloroaromatic compound transport system substrate-binding protein
MRTNGNEIGTHFFCRLDDSFMKFYEAARYYYYPGMHEPGGVISMGINAKWWDSLSNGEKAILIGLTQAENDYMMAEYNANNGKFLDKLINEHGVKLRQFNDDVYDAFGEAANSVFEVVRQHSPLAREIYDSFLTARTEVGRWKNLSEASYYAQRNRVLGVL